MQYTTQNQDKQKIDIHISKWDIFGTVESIIAVLRYITWDNYGTLNCPKERIYVKAQQTRIAYNQLVLL